MTKLDRQISELEDKLAKLKKEKVLASTLKPGVIVLSQWNSNDKYQKEKVMYLHFLPGYGAYKNNDTIFVATMDKNGDVNYNDSKLSQLVPASYDNHMVLSGEENESVFNHILNLVKDK